jgi:hypothetical protein
LALRSYRDKEVVVVSFVHFRCAASIVEMAGFTWHGLI